MKHIAHWDEAEKKYRSEGDIGGHWTMLGQAAQSVGAGVRRIQVDPGKRSTALHAHGAEEEVFFVLGGAGLLWQGDTACTVGPGDCIVHLAEREAHTLRAGSDGLDVLAFGTRVQVEICHLPRAGMAWAGPTVLTAPGFQNLWKRDAESGPVQPPAPGPRPKNVVALESVTPERSDKGSSRMSYRGLGATAGSVKAGIDYATIDPGAVGWPPHCHSAEEEIFVILDGDGTLELWPAPVPLSQGVEREGIPIRAGHVIARPPATRIAHAFQAGPNGLTMLIYGTRRPNDLCWYPRSNKIFWRGLGVIGRIESLDYWDGEDRIW